MSREICELAKEGMTLMTFVGMYRFSTRQVPNMTRFYGPTAPEILTILTHSPNRLLKDTVIIKMGRLIPSAE